MDAWTPPPLLSPLARLPLRAYLGQRRARLNARDATREFAQHRDEREEVELFLRNHQWQRPRPLTENFD